MRDFLLYDIWGGFIFNLPSIAISLLLGYYLAKKYAKNREVSKKKRYLIAGIIAIVFFLVLKSLMI